MEYFFLLFSFIKEILSLIFFVHVKFFVGIVAFRQSQSRRSDELRRLEKWMSGAAKKKKKMEKMHTKVSDSTESPRLIVTALRFFT